MGGAPKKKKPQEAHTNSETHIHTRIEPRKTKLETITSKRKICKPQQSICGKTSNTLEFICVHRLCWAWGPHPSVVCVPSETPLEETNFWFTSGCQLAIASRLGMGDHVQFLLSELGPLWLRPGQALCGLPHSQPFGESNTVKQSLTLSLPRTEPVHLLKPLWEEKGSWVTGCYP